MGRSVEPVVEEPLRLGDAARPEHGPQVLFELPCPEQARPGRLQVVELGPLALRQALPALHQREARPLDGPRRLCESGGVGRRLVAGRRPSGTPPSRRRRPGGPLGHLPLLAAHAVEGVVHPADDVEGVRDPFGIGAPPLDQRLYPPVAVGRHHLDGKPLLAGEFLFEEPAQHLFAPPPRGPDQAAPVVVHHDHEVPVALLVRGLVDADPADAIEARGCVLQVAFRCPQVERASPPRSPASVVGLAGAAACRAAALPEPVRANPDDDGAVFDADGFNDGIGQGEGET